jgi:hypothetical protein
LLCHPELCLSAQIQPKETGLMGIMFKQFCETYYDLQCCLPANQISCRTRKTRQIENEKKTKRNKKKQERKMKKVALAYEKQKLRIKDKRLQIVKMEAQLKRRTLAEMEEVRARITFMKDLIKDLGHTQMTRLQSSLMISLATKASA